jgi:enamine deaminase RidA (YjgF/YER057c/UK114 family)
MNTPKASGIVSTPDYRDERFAATTTAGTLTFVAGVDGQYRPGTTELDRESFADGVRQSRNAYEEIVSRLDSVGLSGRNLVRCENLVASQSYRRPRMALWPEVFGTPTVAVSQGAAAKMRGQNMITATGVAYADAGDIAIVKAGPDERRASRITRAGNWYFVIGVGGAELGANGEPLPAPEDLADQAENAYSNIEAHLETGGIARERIVRYDCYLRDISRAMEHRDIRTKHFDGRMSSTSTVVGAPLGGSTDIELSAMAVGPAAEPEVVFYEGRVDLARTIRADGIIFSSGALGNRDVSGKLVADSYGDPARQLELGLDRSLASLADFGADLSHIARLDIYLKDPYWEPKARDLLVARFPGLVPATTFTGCELEPTAEVEVTALAYRPA